MFALGIAGILQVTWLPGFILLHAVQIKTNRLGNLVFGFGLSLTFNYLLVLVLTALKLFLHWVVIGVFCLELVTAIWISRKFLLEKVGPRLHDFWLHVVESFTNYFANLKKHLSKREHGLFYRKLLFGLFFLLALIPLWWIVRIFIDNLGTVFSSWDAVVSYNQWATQWASNSFPSGTWRYPQLVPTNWALIYVMIGNSSIHFFSKAIMPFFLLSILLHSIALGFKYQKGEFFLACVTTYFVIKHFLFGYIQEGYVDIPTAAMSFTAIGSLFWAKRSDEKNSFRLMILGTVLAGGAACTKHTGLFTLAVFPVLAYLIVMRHSGKQNKVKTIRTILLLFLVAGVVAAPWYIYKEVAFFKGIDSPETNIFQNDKAFGDASLFQRVQISFSQLGKYLVLYLILLASLMFFESDYRWLVLLLVFPYTLVWALFLGYDTRNLAIALPFLSLLATMGLITMLDWVYIKIFHPLGHCLPIAVLIGFLILLPIPAAFLIPSKTIIEHQVELQKQIFSKTLNESLYSLLEGQDLSKIVILTNYPVRYLPGFEQSQLTFYFNDLGVFQTEIKDPKIDFLLVPSYAASDIQTMIQQLLESGELTYILEDHSWISYSLYEVIR
jgi:hypothetical protein